MNCALCANYLAMVNDVKNKGIKIPYCIGCRARNKKCAFIKKTCSSLLKGEADYCFECPDFPCNRIRTLDARYKSQYKMSMIENSLFIKEHGVQKFLEEQKRTWECKSCGELISCHNGVCFNCELEKLRIKKQMYRWDE